MEVIREDDQRTLWYTNGPLELIQLEKVLEPVTPPPTRLPKRRSGTLNRLRLKDR